MTLWEKGEVWRVMRLQPVGRGGVQRKRRRGARRPTMNSGEISISWPSDPFQQMGQGRAQVLFDRAARDAHAGGDLCMGQAFDPVQTKGDADIGRKLLDSCGDPVELQPRPGRILGRGRVGDRYALCSRARNVGPGLVPGRGALSSSDAVQHQIVADPVQEGGWTGDFGRRGVRQGLKSNVDVLHDVFRTIRASGARRKEPDERGAALQVNGEKLSFRIRRHVRIDPRCQTPPYPESAFSNALTFFAMREFGVLKNIFQFD